MKLIEKLKTNFNLTNEECKNIIIPEFLIIEDYKDKIDELILQRKQTGTFIKEKRTNCVNLFTACLLFGKYVPLSTLKYEQKTYTFENGFRISKRGEFYYLYYYIFGENENRLKFTQWVRECNKNEYLRAKKIFDFETLYPGVSYGSVQIEKNKEYRGMIDGNFTIKTVNNKIWIIPETSCFDLYEKIN